MLDLLLSVEHEIPGVLSRLLARVLWRVGLLAIIRPCYLIIFYACINPFAVTIYIGADIVIIQIESDIPIELPVIVVARISLDGTPDCLGRLGVSSYCRDAAFTQIRTEDPEPRTR